MHGMPCMSLVFEKRVWTNVFETFSLPCTKKHHHVDSNIGFSNLYKSLLRLRALIRLLIFMEDCQFGSCKLVFYCLCPCICGSSKWHYGPSKVTSVETLYIGKLVLHMNELQVGGEMALHTVRASKSQGSCYGVCDLHDHNHFFFKSL